MHLCDKNIYQKELPKAIKDNTVKLKQYKFCFCKTKIFTRIKTNAEHNKMKKLNAQNKKFILK